MTDMEYTKLGHSGIEVSRICLGGMSFGEASPKFHQWTLGSDDTQAVIKRALDRGVNFIDTANTYAFGTSEGDARAAWHLDLELTPGSKLPRKLFG